MTNKLSKIKILLIEDNPADVAFIEEMLNEIPNHPYILKSTRTLSKGISLLKESIFDVVLADISLPDNDGLENIKKTKATSPDTPIILLTGLDDMDIASKAIQKGAQDYLVKGKISADLLVRSIKYAIERKKIEKKLSDANRKLQDLAFHDNLTNAINRRPFVDLVEKNIHRAKRDGKKLAILFLDFDNFKIINDTYGHNTGDRALKSAIRKISKVIRKSDLIGRIGGDEFVVCLNNLDTIQNVKQIAEKINLTFSQKIKVGNNLIELSLSIGIAIFPDDTSSVANLLKNSDIAMYKIKRRCKNSFLFFSSIEDKTT